MYKVIFVDNHNVATLEAQLNEAALDGYCWAGMFQSTSRMVIILEQKVSGGIPAAAAKRSHHKKKVDIEAEVLGS